MQKDQVKEQLQGIFRELFEDPTLTLFDEMTAKDVDNWDSLNHINLIVAAERHFSVRLTTKEVSSMKNVGEFIAILSAKAA